MYDSPNTGETLKQAMLRPDGDVRELDRVEIEILPGGYFRWVLWADGQRVFSEQAPADQVCGMLKCTGILVNAALGVFPPDVKPCERN